MKKQLAFSLISSVLIVSCSSSHYYQVYNTVPLNSNPEAEDGLIFENESCITTYNLWSNMGNAGFGFFNKTDENIYLHMDETFYILNGVAYDYFQDRVFTNSLSTGSSSKESKYMYSQSLLGPTYQAREVSSSAGYSEAHNEKHLVVVPPKTTKYFFEYAVNENLIRDCDLPKYPSRKESKTLTYNEADSPLIFGNRITFSVGDSQNLEIFENTFYVSSITNYPKREIIGEKYAEFCEQRLSETQEYFKIKNNPKMFFIKYPKSGLEKY